MKRITLIIVVLSAMVLADNIYFKNGDIIKNCIVKVTKIDYKVELLTPTGLVSLTFPKSNVKKVDRQQFDAGVFSKQIFAGENKIQAVQSNSTAALKFNFSSLPLTILALGVGYDAYQEFQDYDDQITEGMPTEFSDKVRELKNQKQTVAIICFGSAVLNTILAFENVEVRPEDAGMSIAYKF